MTDLITAVTNGNIGRIRELLDMGVDPNEVNTVNYSPLFYAENNLNIMKILLENGANPNNASPGMNEIPLMHAVLLDHIDSVKLLLKYGSDPYLRDIDGNSSLMLARSEGNDEIVSLIENHILRQTAKQNLALSKSMNRRLGYDTPLQYLDNDTMTRIMGHTRRYIPKVSMRMIDEYHSDKLTKAKQRLSTMRGMRDSRSVFSHLREPKLIKDILENLSRHNPNTGVHNRIRQSGRGYSLKKRSKMPYKYN